MISADNLSIRQQIERDFFNSYARTVIKNRSYSYIDCDCAFSEAALDNKFVIRLLGDIRGKNILDLGCGIGEQAVYFGKRGAKVVAVDISDGLLKVARFLIEREGIGDRVYVKNMTAEDLRYDDSYFDIIYGREVLHHVEIARSIREIKRVLKPQGLAVFIEPLDGNPVVGLYRKVAARFRTPSEKPLSKSDFRTISLEFPDMRQENFYLFSLIVFGIYYIYRRFINKKGDLYYWMKDIEKGRMMRSIFISFQYMDKIALKIFPPIRSFCWITVIWCRNRK